MPEKIKLKYFRPASVFNNPATFANKAEYRLIDMHGGEKQISASAYPY